MRRSIGLAVALLFGACATSDRGKDVFRLSDGTKIACVRPPKDIATSSAGATLNANISHVVDVVKVEANAQTTLQRIRAEVPNLQATEVLDYRLCTAYGNDPANEGPIL